MERLPESQAVDVGRLAAVFRNATNSYKFLFFHSLLDAVAKPEASPNRPLSRRQLAAGMIATAWFPKQHFRLSFGSSGPSCQPHRCHQPERTDLACRSTRRDGQTPTSPRGAASPARSSAHCFATPDAPPAGLLPGADRAADWLVDREVVSLAREHFEEYRPLYRIEPGAFHVHSRWFEYLRENMAVVRGWAFWEWLAFMQARNPNTPSLSTKLLPPRERPA